MGIPDWANLTDELLLEQKISRLGLTIEGTPLQAQVQQLYDELTAKGQTFHPVCHVGDEWFVPVGIPAIFVPFFLVHDRLRALEAKMMLEVEGDTPGGIEEWKAARFAAVDGGAPSGKLTAKRETQGRP